MTLSISSAFDAGNIRVLSITDSSADLEIVTDHQSDFYQWFHFRLGGRGGPGCHAAHRQLRQIGLSDGWANYKARVSEDRENWLQADTDYADGVLTIRVSPDSNAMWVAYFAPYSIERHHDLIGWAANQPGVETHETRTDARWPAAGRHHAGRGTQAGLALRPSASW